MKKYIVFQFLFLSSFVLLSQQKTEPLSLKSPYNTVYNHLFYLQPDTYQPSKSAVTIWGKTEEEAIDIAIKIKQILDAKNLYVVSAQLPKDSLFVDSLGKHHYYLFPKKLPEIRLELKEGKWYYAESTTEQVPNLHQQMYPLGSDILLNNFPRLGTGKFLGLMVWQYLGFGIFLLISFLLYFLCNKLIDIILLQLAKTKLDGAYINKDIIHKVGRYLSFILLISLFALFLRILQFPIFIAKYLYLSLDIIKYTFFIFLGLSIFDFIMVYLNKLTMKTDSKMDDQLLLILKRGIQIAIVIFGVISILNRLGINVAALIAGVSIGGLAIALAAQDSVKNLIGAFMVFLDRPFDVGDYIITGSVQGVVQEVGFRSTRLQASDTSIISIPNGKIANEVVNNLGRRVYRRYRTQLGIKYSTPPELIQLFVQGIEAIIKANPNTLDEKTTIHLNEFAASSLHIFIQTFFNIDSWSSEMKEKETIMIQIIKLAELLNVDFAFPTQSIYIEETSNENKHKNKETLEKELHDFIIKYKEDIKS